MKILLLSHVFPPQKGGSGRWLWELYRRLTDFDVRIVAGDIAGADVFDRSSALPTTRIRLDLPSWGLLNPGGAAGYARAFRVLGRLVRAHRPDVIHCGKCLPEGLLALGMKLRHRIPFCCFVHGEELALARSSRELAWLTRRVLRAATTLVANSHHSRAMLVSEWGIPHDKIVVLHPGVDTSRFVPSEEDAVIRRQLGWAGRRVILTVGALQKRKGQDMLIRALPAIRARCTDVLYAIVGQGWERRYLEDLAHELGVADAVQFREAPSDEELVQCYQQCDIFALPNRRVGWDFEGFGIALIEAQACGKAVIAGASGGAPETIRAGETGKLVSCETPDALAETAVLLLQQSAVRTAMGRSAREWAVQQFDWSRLVPQARAAFVAV